MFVGILSARIRPLLKSIRIKLDAATVGAAGVNMVLAACNEAVGANINSQANRKERDRKVNIMVTVWDSFWKLTL